MRESKGETAQNARPQCVKKESCKLPKGFAIGSAALVSLALYGAFVIRLRVKTGVP